MVAIFCENLSFFSRNLENGWVIIEKNRANVKGNRKIPSLKSRYTTISTSTIYKIKYNFLKSNLL